MTLTIFRFVQIIDIKYTLYYCYILLRVKLFHEINRLLILILKAINNFKRIYDPHNTFELPFLIQTSRKRQKLITSL